MRKALLPIAILFSAPSFAQLVINEIDYDQPSTDSAEYLELKNTSDAPVAMANVSIVLVNGSSGNPAVYRSITSSAWALLAPGDYFTLCSSASSGCDDTLPVASNAIQNGPMDAIALLDLTDSTIIDMVGYEGDVTGWTEGTGTVWGDDNTNEGRSLGRFPDGADSGDNAADFIRMCDTPGATNVGDTMGCTTATGIRERSLSPSLTVFAEPANDRVWMYVQIAQAAPVTFEVFALDGSLMATRTVNNGTKASWAWPTNGMHGRMLVVRATTASGSVARRIVLP